MSRARRAAFALLFGLATTPLALAGENRLWRAELVLEGPLERVRVDCGAAGATLVEGPLLAGERRSVSVSVPVRAPLGADGLAALPAPRLSVEPPGSGAARFVGFAELQPAGRLRAVPAGVRARPRPPLTDGAPRPRPHALLLVGGAWVVALGARRRRRGGLATLAVGALAGAVVVGTGARTPEALPRVLEEWDLASPRGLEVEGALGALALFEDGNALARDGLEVAPEGAPLVIEHALAGGGERVRAPGVALFGLRRLDAPPRLALAAARNDARALAAAWVRSADGGLEAVGPWPLGVALPPARPADPPPGWLRAGLPAGRAVVLARVAGAPERWLRAVGFEERD